MKISRIIIIFLSLTGILSSAYAAQLICPNNLKGHIHKLTLDKQDIHGNKYIFRTNKFNYKELTYNTTLTLHANNKDNAIKSAKSIITNTTFNLPTSKLRNACVYTYQGHKVIAKYKNN